MPTHKLANDFIKKWNKELAIKGYSKMKVTEKTALIEKRLKEVKSKMVKDMKKEWTGITSKYSTKIKSNEEKRAKAKEKMKPKEKPKKIGPLKLLTPEEKAKLQKKVDDKKKKPKKKIGPLKLLTPEEKAKLQKEVDAKKKKTKKEEPKKIPKNLKESIEGGVELEKEGLPGLESSQYRERRCRHILILSRGLIEAEKKGFPKVIDSNKEKFVDTGIGSPSNILLKNPKLKKTSLGLTAESSVPTSQLEQIITFFQNHFYKYTNKFNKETPAKARGDILRACGATEAQVYDKAVEILKKDYPTIIKKINSFKTKKRIELEALPENKLSEYEKELKTVIPNFLGTSTQKEKEPSKQIVPVSQKSAEKPKKETGPAVLRKMRTEMARNYRETFGKNLYDVLGIPKNSNPTSEELKNICRKLKLKNHPDKGGSTQKIQEINEACRILEETIKKPKEKAPPKKPKKETGEVKKSSVDRRTRTTLEKDFKNTYKKTIYKVLEIPNKSNPSSEELKEICSKLKNKPENKGNPEKIKQIDEACKIIEETIKK